MSNGKSEETIFCEALEIPAERRAEFLKLACANDPAMLESVKSLLQLHDTEEGFLATPAIGVAQDAVEERAGDHVGCYRLEHQIGEGGFGIVWQAQQLEPIKRRVALKIVKLGMNSESIISRFDDERQTLALMNHPNIATVLDAGVTDGGRPFFAMELVEGESIDRYCSDRKVSDSEKLEIFVSVCRGLQHAHQKGVVHRDLKPSNILIASNEDHVVAKVIDFGIATAIQTDDKSAGAEKIGGPVGTPQYMSPEQWRNEADIDTRADIYSLGVVLFRLLTGTTPEPNYLAGEEPLTRPSQIQRQTGWAGFDSKIAEDLDWITCKAMSYHREDRYQSASEMAMDIERFLNGRAVIAHPGGTSYQLRKLVNRNKFTVGSAALTFLALLAAVFASTWGMIYANEQKAIANKQRQAAQDNEKEAIRLKEIAETEARKLRVVANVLKNLLPEANPYRGMRSGFQIREHLDQLINSVDTLSSEPELEADLRVTAAKVYENISRPGRARHQFALAKKIREETLGENHPKTLLCLAGMASCNIELGRLEAAEGMIQEVIEKSEGSAPRNHINALRTLRKIRYEQKRYPEALEIAEQCRTLAKSVFKHEIFGRIHVANEYSVSAMKMGMTEEAENVVRNSLTLLERDHPDRKFVIANSKHRLAQVLMEAKKFDEAKIYANSFVEMQKLTLGENDVYVIRGLTMLAEIHRRDDDLLVAEQIALDAVERSERLEKDQIWIRRLATRELAKILERLDLKRSSASWEKAIEHGWVMLGGHSSVVDDILRLARIYDQLDELDKGLSCLTRVIEILENRKGASKKKLLAAYQLASELLERDDKPERAQEFLEKATKLESRLQRQ